ncbi:hypothetical protein BSL78_18797, partial [Apostichopus japonicus]
MRSTSAVKRRKSTKLAEQRKAKANSSKQSVLGKRNRKGKNLTTGRSKSKQHDSFLTDGAKVTVIDLNENTLLTDCHAETVPGESYVRNEDVVVVDTGQSQKLQGLSEDEESFTSAYDDSHTRSESTRCELLLKVGVVLKNCTTMGHYIGALQEEVLLHPIGQSIIARLPQGDCKEEELTGGGSNQIKRSRKKRSKVTKRKQLSRNTDGQEDDQSLEKSNKISLEDCTEMVSTEGNNDDEDYGNNAEGDSGMVPPSGVEGNADTTEEGASLIQFQDVSDRQLSEMGEAENVQPMDLSWAGGLLTEKARLSSVPSEMEKSADEGNRNNEIPYRIFRQKDPEQYLVLFEKETFVPFVGKGSMKIICGSVSVNGFKMDRDSGWREIYSTSFNHLVRLSVQLPIRDEVQEEVVNDISQRVEDQDRAELEAFLENRGSFSAFLLQHLDCIAWEFAGQMQTFSELMNDVQYESNLGKKYSQYFSTLGLFLCPDSLIYASKAMRTLHGQEEATDLIMQAFTELRSPRTDSVCYLEADTGQSEFTPSCIISLHEVKEPLLGLPFVHQRKAAKMLFYGSNETKDDPDLYLHMLSLLHQHYQETFPSKALIVNTNGWMSGLGGALLQDIREIVKPTHIISMQDPTDKHPFDFHSQSGWLSENIISNTSSKLLEVQATPGRSSGLGAAQHRSLTLIGYFSSLLQPMTSSSVRFSLAAVTPYIVPWSSVAVHVCNKALSPNHILYALNGTVVGLAAVDSSKIYEIEGSTPSDGLPKLLKETPVCECLGVGLIRGIDPVSKLFYIITPAPSEQLQRVNALVKGTHSLPLTALKQ